MDGSYVISVSLDTGCYRHIQINGSDTLCELSDAILDAFDFLDDHLHAFFMNNHVWEDGPDAYYHPDVEDAEQFTDEVTLDELDLIPGMRFIYLFDFGDEWRFSCRVLRELDDMIDEPCVLRTVGEAPDQYPDDEEDDWDNDDEDDWEDEDDWDDDDDEDEDGINDFIVISPLL